MRRRSEEEFYQAYCDKSLILSPDKNKEAGRVWMMDFSKEGLAGMLLQRNDPDEGSLKYYRESWKKALADWDSYRRTLPVPPPKSEPIGIFQEKINESRGRMRACEAECRKLNALLKEMKEQEQEAVQKKARPFNGSIKNMNGKPAICDGRKLIEKDGVLVFQDDAKLTLEKYLDQCRTHKREKSKLKREKHNVALLAEAKHRYGDGEPATLGRKKRRKIANG